MAVRTRVGVTTVLFVLAGCQRPLLGPDSDSDDSTSSAETTTAFEASTGASTAAMPACHASYSPCLPITDDLDCPDIVALGLAPVEVSGPDDYGLDADGDGLGCEQ